MAAGVGLTREMIVQEAVRLADEVGWNRLTWTSLAGALGIKPPSLYNHVASFDELRSELAVRGLGGLRDALSTAVAGAAGTEALKALGRSYVQFARRHPSLYQASLRAPAPGEETFGKLARETLDLVFGVLEPFHLTEETVVHAVRVLRSALHGLVAIDLAGGFRMPQGLDTTLEVLLTTLVVGFQSLSNTEASQ